MPDLALGLMIGEGDADSHIPPIELMEHYRQKADPI